MPVNPPASAIAASSGSCGASPSLARLTEVLDVAAGLVVGDDEPPLGDVDAVGARRQRERPGGRSRARGCPPPRRGCARRRCGAPAPSRRTRPRSARSAAPRRPRRAASPSSSASAALGDGHQLGARVGRQRLREAVARSGRARRARSGRAAPHRAGGRAAAAPPAAGCARRRWRRDWRSTSRSPSRSAGADAAPAAGLGSGARTGRAGPSSALRACAQASHGSPAPGAGAQARQQRLQAQQPARGHRRHAVDLGGAREIDLGRAEQRREDVRRIADALLGRRQTELGRIGRLSQGPGSAALRPGALVERAQDDDVGLLQARLVGLPDGDARMGRRRAARSSPPRRCRGRTRRSRPPPCRARASRHRAAWQRTWRPPRRPCPATALSAGSALPASASASAALTCACGDRAGAALAGDGNMLRAAATPAPAPSPAWRAASSRRS